MNNQIETFINYLLDTETTSEITFIEIIQKNNELFQSRYFKDWELSVFRKLQNVHRNTNVITLNTVDNGQKSESDTSEEESTAAASSSEDDSDDDDDDDEEEEEENKTNQPNQNSHISHSNKITDIYVDTTRQYQRLVRLLYHCYQHYSHFTELYYHTLDQYIKSDNEKILAIAFQQIAVHLFEGKSNDNDCQRLMKLLPTNTLTANIPLLHQSIRNLIETISSTNINEINTINFLSNHIDILYPYTTRFLDVRREFRDATCYFIDGDSLLLSIAHHVNTNLNSYYGNTLHVIFIIERILLTLYQQSHQCNYTLIFFDCHYHLYQQENSILSLLRSCLIAHLSKNTEIKIEQFPSWFDEKYIKYTQDENPMFMFYHDMSTFDLEKDTFLSKDILEKLLGMYRLFGNYHQYEIKCQLYLMNKLILTETTVKCFQVQFNRKCPKNLFENITKIIPTNSYLNGVEEQNWKELPEDDVRLFIYLKAISNFIQNNQQQQQQQHLIELLNPLLILHVALLSRLSLNDRHLSASFPSITFSSTFSQLIIQFQHHLSSCLSSSLLSSSLSWSKIADLFDGRLFAFTLYYIYQTSSNIRLDSKTSEIVRQSLALLNIPFNDNLFDNIVKQLIESQNTFFSSLENQIVSNNQERKDHKIIRISNPFIDTYLTPILSSNNQLTSNLINPDDWNPTSQEQRHRWDVYKQVGDEIGRIKDNDVDYKKKTDHRYRTKNLQKLYDYFTLYGRSLTTRDVRDNQLQIILPTASTPIPTNKENSIDRSDTASASGGKKKQQHKGQSNKVQQSKAEKIKEQNKQRILDKRTDDETDKIKIVEARLKQIPADNFSEGIDLIDESLIGFETTTIRLELLKRKFELQRKYLRTLKKKKSLTIEETSKLELLQIGFFATLCEMVHLENIADAFNEKKKYMEELVDDSSLNAEKWYRFQLEKINSRLPRRQQGVPDERVKDFIPDEWQVKFLNAVDKRESIIIVAPTASGKTYASYYAMGDVLKKDATGICVYVAPTKALINQVAGTIHTKFGPVFGIFTQDYRMNMQTCRILVTIPECLEMLLLSPMYQRWCQRIRYCIFDEIHCMSGDIGSDVWERIMLLINCPMIGLSATVNNGKALQDWIENIEIERSKLFKNSERRKVQFISHNERLADLNKYLYSNRQLHPLHPVGLMNAKQLTSRGIPKDFSLSPNETLRLNEAIQETDMRSDQVPTLTEHFSPGWIAERNVCNTYSRLVCDQFNDIIKAKDSSSTIDAISSSLNPTVSNKIHYPELKPMSSLIGEFVLTLKEKNLLPCIVFTDSRSLCEELAENVAQYFEEREKELRQTKYKHQIEALEKRLAQIEKAQKSAKAKKAVKTTSKRGNDDEETPSDKPGELRQMEEEDQGQCRLSGYEQDLLNGVLEEGTLANRRGCDRELVDRLMERAATVNQRLARYIKRGVAFHHSQLNNRGRLAVEGLFRNRYVQIVFSTWTLALGVHMPTKTVAFVKDSIHLDALQYRQSSGRAGRRGFDVQGNIIFIDIPMSKIRHLTISAIPNIQTHFPTSVTFLIRLLNLYSNAEDKKDAINRALVALQCPFSAQSPNTRHLIDTQIRFHCLYTLDFLYRLNFINEQGDLIGLAGFSTHLRDVEPANILFTYLINTKVFHQLNDEEQIVDLLAHLFTNRPWSVIHQQSNSSTSTQRQKPMFNSSLALRTITPEIRKHIQKYNSLVKEIYGSYIENVIKQIRSFNNNQEHCLPLSKIPFIQSSDYDNGTFEYNLHHHHSQQSQNPSISPFAGPSGLTHEQFMSNYNPTIGSWDLACDLDLSPRIVPFVDIDVRDHTNASYYLNSYALDFFKHGSERLLLTENELNRDETYHSLLEFLHSLTSIKTSIQNIIEDEIKQARANDTAFFKPIAKKFSDIQLDFSSKFYKHFK